MAAIRPALPTVVAVVVGATMMVIGALPTIHASGTRRVGSVQNATSVERSAGCGGVRIDPIERSRRHTTARVDYSQAPPSSGPHTPVPLVSRTRFYGLPGDVAPERAVHNLEHGYVVIWYDAIRLPHRRDIEALRSMSELLPRLLVIPWTRGPLQEGSPLVLTSWGYSERCVHADRAVISSFYSAHVNHSPEAGR